MATVWRDLLLLLPVSAVVLLVVLKPDIPTIVELASKLIFLLGMTVLVIHLIGRSLKYLKSSFETAPSNPIQNNPSRDAVDMVRENTQIAYNEQVARFQEEVILPKQEEVRSKKEMKFYQFTGLPWTSPGHTLGGTKEISESSLRQRASSSAAEEADGVCDGGCRVQNPNQTGVSQPSQKFSLPDEPELNEPNAVTVALKTPQGRTHKRRFRIAGEAELLLRFMASIGYHHKLYALYMSYPRQSISDDPNVTLEELGITHDILLNIEEKD